MATHRFCEQCGAPLREGVKFCENCGAALEGANEAVSAPVESAEESRNAQPAWRYLAIKVAIGVGAFLLVGVGGWWLVQDREEADALPEVAMPTIPESDPASPFHESTPEQPDETPASSNPAPEETEAPASSAETSVAVENPPAAAATDSTSGLALVEGGDFSAGTPNGLSGDGARIEHDGQASWQLQGPGDLGISVPLSVSSGQGTLRVRYRVFLPESTQVDPALGGVRLRARLTDRYESSAVSDRVLQPFSNWQSVELSFEDTGSGPYILQIEAFGMTGPLWLDDIGVFAVGGDASSMPTTETDTPAPSPEPTAEPVARGTELEQWVMNRPWFRQLAESMPNGVTLSVQEGRSEFEGWGAFEIREHHAEGSGFDPSVAPLVGLFQVSPLRDGMSWMDPVAGDWVPIEDFFADRGLTNAQL